MEDLVNSYAPEYEGELSQFLTQPTDIVPRPDPVAYFREFCHVHSADGPPMQYGNTLLFPDGWTHSAVSYDGPEFPPPEDSYSLMRLRKLYWLLRRRLIVRHFDEFKLRMANLEHLQQFKSAPLMVSRMRRTKSGNYRVESKPIDLQLLQIEREKLQAEVDLCEATLTAIDKQMKSYSGVTA